MLLHLHHACLFYSIDIDYSSRGFYEDVQHHKGPYNKCYDNTTYKELPNCIEYLMTIFEEWLCLSQCTPSRYLLAQTRHPRHPPLNHNRATIPS